MPKSQKKEPGHADVEQRERGDSRLTPPSKSRPADQASDKAQDRPPADSDHDKDSPWLGGG